MNDDTLLLRQINKSWILHDSVTTQAFKPTTKDNQKLSLYDGDMFTPEQSFQHFADRGLTSAGVLGLTVSEFHSESLITAADGNPFPGHVSVDYSPCSRKEVEKKSKILRDKAMRRNWLYSEPAESAEAAALDENHS